MLVVSSTGVGGGRSVLGTASRNEKMKERPKIYYPFKKMRV
jgi:hypothetical protein